MSRTARVTVALAGMLLAIAATVAGAAPASATTVPYTDPSVTGSIGLCDRSGHQITSGSTEDLPLAWISISSMPAPAGYNDGKAKATLYAYQPRKDVDPGEWSGSPLTASSFFSSPAHPMAAFTTGDKRLHEVLQAYPARWDGFVQLRLFFSAPNKPAVSQTYPAANLQVSGTSWHQIGAPAVSCSSGKAVSVETLYLPASKFPAPSKATPSPAAAAGLGAGTDGSSDATNVAAGQQQPSAAAATSTPMSSLIVAGLLAVAVLGIGIVGVLWMRNRWAS